MNLRIWRTPLAVMLCGGAILMLSMGIRHGFGLFLRPMTLDLNWTRGSFAFAIALQNLVWGLAQPWAGMIADRYGAGRVLAAGGFLYAAGLVVMAHAETAADLALGAGILIGLGLAGTYTIVFGVVGRTVAPQRRSVALGALSAMASFGQFAMLPYGQSLISSLGWWWALLILAGNVFMILPLSLALAGNPAASPGAALGQSIGSALTEARRHSGFWLICLGFSVCGFQVVFIATHLPSYLLDQGMTADTGMVALALIGLANIAGSYLAGHLGARHPKQLLLAGLYLLRALVICAFVLLPVTNWTVYLFAIAIGLLWLGTVPLTSGLVAQIFGVQYLSMLFGIVYVGHQLGAFLGGWLGGYAYDLSGSYTAVWAASIGLSLIAAVLNFHADDREIERVAPVAQAA
jgi:MFS family permease